MLRDDEKEWISKAKEAKEARSKRVDEIVAALKRLADQEVQWVRDVLVKAEGSVRDTTAVVKSDDE